MIALNIEPTELSNWETKAIPAYDSNGKPNFLDSHDELQEGIYLGLPEKTYHSLEAMSSSALKKFMESPAHYYRNYLSGISRKRTTALKNTLDAGKLAHELVLEPEGFYNRYFRRLLPIDRPDALNSAKDIEAELLKLNLPRSGTKSEKAMRLAKADPTIEIFEIIEQEHNEWQGPRNVVMNDGESVTTFGGKVPMDGQVWDDAHRASETTRKHAEANAYIQNGLPEITIIARCPITDLMLKVRFDWLRFDDEAVDLKTTQSTRPDKFKRQLHDLHYDVQQEFYKYVAELQGIFIKQFTFVATEYVNADICQPFILNDQMIAKAKRKTKNGLLELVACMEEDRWFGWSKTDCTMRFE